jgi:hypothetical protein
LINPNGLKSHQGHRFRDCGLLPSFHFLSFCKLRSRLGHPAFLRLFPILKRPRFFADIMMKMVRFSSDLCTFHAGAVLDIDCALERDLWYQTDELKQIKRHALILSRDECAKYLCPLLSSTYGRTDTRSENAVSSWVILCDSRRGLERFINKEYSMKRSETRLRTMQAILTAQHKMQKEGLEDTNYMSTALSRLSEKLSKESSKYAINVGRADMTVASSDVSDSAYFSVDNVNDDNLGISSSSMDVSYDFALPSKKCFSREGKGTIKYEPTLIFGHILAHRGLSEMRHFY